MSEKPTSSEVEEIVAALKSGDRLKAVSIYISRTNSGLTEAQKFVRALMENLEGAGKSDH